MSSEFPNACKRNLLRDAGRSEATSVIQLGTRSVSWVYSLTLCLVFHVPCCCFIIFFFFYKKYYLVIPTTIGKKKRDRVVSCICNLRDHNNFLMGTHMGRVSQCFTLSTGFLDYSFWLPVVPCQKKKKKKCFSIVLETILILL